jgi:hypothetical protein
MSALGVCGGVISLCAKRLGFASVSILGVGCLGAAGRARRVCFDVVGSLKLTVLGRNLIFVNPYPPGRAFKKGTVEVGEATYRETTKTVIVRAYEGVRGPVVEESRFKRRQWQGMVGS